MPSYSGIFTLQAQMQAIGQGLWIEPFPTVIGQPYGGGFYAGQIGVSSVATHYLVVAPLSSGQTTLEWKNTSSSTTGAGSSIDGPQNTADMVAEGSSTIYPCAHFCNDLVVGGKTDWYMPAKNELEVCYYNLKPTTDTNSTSSGINANAVPARASNYTSGTPAQTSATNFQNTGAEPFDGGPSAGCYWTSTKSGNYAIGQPFRNGNQGVYLKNNPYKVRAIRRVAV